MKYKSLLLEKKEYVYLKRILNISGYAEDFETQKSLIRLNDELKKAQILDDREMPEDVIRFNSLVVVSSDKGWEKTIQIVAPADRDLKQNKISILTTMGSALFGYAQGDKVAWDFPNGTQQLTIREVSQSKNFEKIEVPI